jgi:hypothetical protein
MQTPRPSLSVRGRTLVHGHHGYRFPGELHVYTRPAFEDEATTALAWVASREGKTLVQLVQELHAADSSEGISRSAS